MKIVTLCLISWFYFLLALSNVTYGAATTPDSSLLGPLNNQPTQSFVLQTGVFTTTGGASNFLMWTVCPPAFTPSGTMSVVLVPQNTGGCAFIAVNSYSGQAMTITPNIWNGYTVAFSLGVHLNGSCADITNGIRIHYTVYCIAP